MTNDDLNLIAYGFGDVYALLRFAPSHKLKLKSDWDSWKEGIYPRPCITQERLDNITGYPRDINDGFDLLRAARSGQLEVK